MELTQNKDFENLLDNLQKCLKTYSVKELNDALVTIFSKKQDNSLEVNFVLDEVAKEYSISKRTLIHSKARGNTQEAREVAYCLLNLNLGITLRHIGNRIFLKGAHNGVVRALDKFRKLNMEVKQDREFKERYEKIQQKLANFIIENK